MLDLNHCGYQLNQEEDHHIWSCNQGTGEVTVKQDYDAILFALYKSQ